MTSLETTGATKSFILFPVAERLEKQCVEEGKETDLNFGVFNVTILMIERNLCDLQMNPSPSFPRTVFQRGVV